MFPDEPKFEQANRMMQAMYHLMQALAYELRGNLHYENVDVTLDIDVGPDKSKGFHLSHDDPFSL